MLVSSGLPAARARFEDGVETRAVVGDATGGGDTSAREGDELAGGEDHLGEEVKLLLKNLGGVEVLFLLFFSLESSVCHCVIYLVAELKL